MHSFFKISVASLAIISLNSYAFHPQGNIPAHVMQNTADLEKQQTTKSISLINLNLTAQETQRIINYHPHIKYVRQEKYPAQLYLGMNNVPVLDQGTHGTCVTFAATAAVEALMNKGDYISQVCQLELGSYLQKNSYRLSGWEGSSGDEILSQMVHYGIVSKDKQRAGLCGGVKEYPLDFFWREGNPLSLKTYAKLSEKLGFVKTPTLSQSFIYRPIFNIYDRFGLSGNEYNGNEIIDTIKRILNENQTNLNTRVIFGVMVNPAKCNVGACATFHVKQDTWALSDEIENDPQPLLAGHEMIITGYDDIAVAVDNNGQKHQGLFVLRNSWGAQAGNKGDFYMTYDYFAKYAMDANSLFFAQSEVK